jgi:hypothetical protein
MGTWPMNSAGPSWGTVRPRRDGVGHRHLHCLLRVHHAIQQAGVESAVGTLTMLRFAEGAAACRYFGLYQLADLLMEIPRASASPRTARAFDLEYREHVSTGTDVAAAIRRKIAACPQDFPVAPI